MVAVNGKRIPIAELSKQETERDDVFGLRLNPGLHVIVVHTTTEGTLGALKAAGSLAIAKNLDARVGLAVIEVVRGRHRSARD